MFQPRLAAPQFVWRFADAQFDEARHELSVSGHRVEMEPRPLEVLMQLLRHAGEVVTKEDLLDSVYGHRHLSDGALAQAVRRLRRALNDDAQLVIATVHRVGYKLASPVNRSEIAGHAPRPTLLKAGDQVPRREHWRLLRALGAGTAEVWLIEHEKTRAVRVLKLCTDAIRLSALKREVTLSRVLRDTLGERDEFVSVIDWNFDHSPYFIESEYGGVTLVEWAESLGGLAAIDLADRVNMLAAAAQAVAAAHGAGVLHKDLKPANVLVQRAVDGGWRPRLIDFGGGRLLEPARFESLGITQQGFTRQLASDEDDPTGTPMYLAPELLAGQMPTVQSDVHALGVMLYQAAAGDFRKPMTSGWEDDVNEASLRRVIALATHGNPLKRLNSAQDLVDRLRSPGESVPTPAAPARGLKTRAGWAALCVLTGLGIGIAAWRAQVHPRAPTDQGSSNVAASDAYLHALALSRRRQSDVANVRDSVESLQRAVALDPGFVAAWALLAQQNAHLYFNHHDPEANRTAARRALDVATRLQPDSPVTLTAQGYYSYWVNADYVAAEAVLKRVHEKWPDRSDATVGLALIARRRGETSDAAAYFEEALAKDPLNTDLAIGAARARLALQDFPAALKLTNHALDITPGEVLAIGLKGQIYQQLGDLRASDEALNAVKNRVGDFDAVRQLAEQARLQRRFAAAIDLWRAYLANPESTASAEGNLAGGELGHLLMITRDTAAATQILTAVRARLEEERNQQPSDPIPVGALALIAADLGEREQAKTLARTAAAFEVVKGDASRTVFFEAIRARVAARTGDRDQAFASLRLLMAEPIGAIAPGLLPLDPEWDVLRSDPRFAALLAEFPPRRIHAG